MKLVRIEFTSLGICGHHQPLDQLTSQPIHDLTCSSHTIVYSPIRFYSKRFIRNDLGKCKSPIRELGGWNSASQIQKPHFLAAKIIWRFRNVGQMNRPEFRAVTALSDEADQHSRKYLKEFKLYRTDIRSKGPNPQSARAWPCYLAWFV